MRANEAPPSARVPKMGMGSGCWRCTLLVAIAAVPMGTALRAYRPTEARLLPGSIRDWLLEDHLVYCVSDFVNRLTLSAFSLPTPMMVAAAVRTIRC